MTDLVVLVPDKNMEATVHALLSRPETLRIRAIDFDVYVHPERDPGCLRDGHNFLRPFAHRRDHALVLFDFQGCGKENVAIEHLEEEASARLRQNGWSDRGSVCVVDPELEVWVWSDSPEVDVCLGWGSYVTQIPLRRWLVEQGYASSASEKPSDPKASLEAVLRYVRKPRSSSLYKQLAQRVGVDRCVDPSFRRFKDILSEWFGQQ